jgi:hypothetical protein
VGDVLAQGLLKLRKQFFRLFTAAAATFTLVNFPSLFGNISSGKSNAPLGLPELSFQCLNIHGGFPTEAARTWRAKSFSLLNEG